jgi:hypothetical protein
VFEVVSARMHGMENVGKKTTSKDTSKNFNKTKRNLKKLKKKTSECQKKIKLQKT